MAETFGNETIPKPSPREMDVEVGVRSNMPFVQTYIDEQNTLKSPKELVAELLPQWNESDGPNILQLQAMRRTDAQARALYRMITLPLRANLPECEFVPDESGDGEEEAEFIKNMFTLPASQGGMVIPFGRVMAEILTGVFNGFAAFEQIYTMPKKGPLKGKYCLKELSLRPAETVTFLVDKSGHFAGIRQRASKNGEMIDRAIQARDAFYYAAQEEENPFYGKSFFESAFYSHDKKMKLYFVAHLAAQRAAIGTRYGQYPKDATKTEKAAFARKLADLGIAQWMTMPIGFDVEILHETNNFDYLSLINHHNNQMSKSVLALDLDDAKGSGANDATMVNFAQDNTTYFWMMLKTIQDDIAEAINTYIIPKFIDWNFGTGKYPKFKWAPLTDEQKNVIFEMFKTLATSMGPSITDEFRMEMEKRVSKYLGFTDIDYDAIEEEREEEKERLADAMLNPAQHSAPGTTPGSDVAGFDMASFDQQASVAATSADEQNLIKLTSQLVGLVNGG